MVLYSAILIGLPMEMKLCHMLVGKYLALHENRESRHVRGGFRKLRGPMDSCPKYILISMAKYKLDKLVSPGGAHGQHHAGGVRGAAVRDDTSPQPDFCLINWHLVIQRCLHLDQVVVVGGQGSGGGGSGQGGGGARRGARAPHVREGSEDVRKFLSFYKRRNSVCVDLYLPACYQKMPSYDDLCTLCCLWVGHLPHK